ncbi:unnamed protein product [Pelagomonas calceolata]|uniref:Uncharacterized protein n=1 Tax=Pelagomonas calceolata TaxID=35677 RepID=A0A8J2WJF3_9STRA|nr:unnamed protein product [Pelagomonas calceolata]
MFHDELINIEALHLRVRLGVLQQIQDDLGRLLGPAALRARGVAELALRVSPAAARELREGDGLLELEDVFEVRLGLGQLHALDVVADLAAVLEVGPQGGAPRLRGLDGLVGVEGVLAHLCKACVIEGYGAVHGCFSSLSVRAAAAYGVGLAVASPDGRPSRRGGVWRRLGRWLRRRPGRRLRRGLRRGSAVSSAVGSPLLAGRWHGPKVT